MSVLNKCVHEVCNPHFKEKAHGTWNAKIEHTVGLKCQLNENIHMYSVTYLPQRISRRAEYALQSASSARGSDMGTSGSWPSNTSAAHLIVELAIFSL